MTDGSGRTLNKLQYPLKIGLTVLFVGLVFYFFDPGAILAVVQNTSLPLYSTVVLGHFVIIAVKALRWQRLLNSFQIQCSYRQALKAYIAAFSIGTFTPGQVGDIAKVLLIDAARGRRKLALIPSIGDRLWDLFGLCVISVVCIFILFLSHMNSSQMILYGFVGCVLGFSVVVGVYPLARKVIEHKYGVNIGRLFTLWPSSILLTLLAMFVQITRWGVLAMAMGVPIITATAIAMLGTLVALIPVSLGGLGTREATMAALFASCGLASLSGVTFSLLMFGAYLFGAIVGAIVLYTYKIDLRSQSSVDERQLKS